MKSRFLNGLMLVFLISCAFGETVKMKDGIIKSRISSKQLNRISVKNDRIESVSGLDAAFHFSQNEKTGDGYIKSTEENGHEPIVVSITTVSGRVQDLMLEVDDGAPNTLILENDEVQDSDGLFQNDSDTSTNVSSDYETSVIDGMKKLIIAEDLLPIRLHLKPIKSVSGFCVKLLNSYRVGERFIGHKFQISSDSKIMTKLKESDFWSEGDVALSFSDIDVSGGKTLFLYVLVRA